MAHIGVDLDGVCYDFTGAFCERVGWDPSEVKQWKFFEQKDMSLDEFLRHCQEAIHAGEMFRKGHVLPGCVQGIKDLVGHGHKIHFISDRLSLGAGEAVVRTSTHKWIQENFPFLGFDYTLDLTADKVTAAKAVDIKYFIDDKIENYDELDAAGVKVWLIDRPWNWSTDLPRKFRRRVHTWQDFVIQVKISEMGANMERREATREEVEQHLNLTQGSINRVEERIVSKTGGEKGQKLAREGSLDPWAIMQVSNVAGFGEQKYSRLNYLKGYEWSLSYDAMQRHLKLFWSGEDTDPESGLPHLAHAAWHCLAMMAFAHHGLGTDDRYVKQ